MDKTKTIEKLKEESSTVYSAAKILLIIFAVSGIINGIVLFFGLLFQNQVVAVLKGTIEGGVFLKLLTLTMGLLVGNSELLNAEGMFQLNPFLSSLINSILSSIILCYIIFCILKIFKKIKEGETPFTSANASLWRKCSNIFAVMATIYFFISFLIPPLIISVIYPIMLCCFFRTLEFIFDYGSQLQQESDETL